MNKSKLFNLTRLRLTSYYVGVMGLILSLCGVAFYGLVAELQWYALHRELKSIAGTLHDGLEPNLKQPGKVESIAQDIIPELCLVGSTCVRDKTTHRHVLGAVQQEGYYARFLTQSGQLVATVGKQPDNLPFIQGNERWQTLQDRYGQRYHHISLLLKTANNQPWGYLQVGRSLQEFDNYLVVTRWVLLAGLPIIMVLVTGASWWLAGLAMRPVYQSYDQIQQFTGDAAHELRTPLAATKATVEAALEAKHLTISEAQTTLQTIDRQNNRLIQLVQDLLLLSRMDLQMLPLKPRMVKLDAVITDLMDEYEALAVTSGLRLNVEKLTLQSVVICGDEEQLYRLVANLLINAIQYTPTGGGITIRLNSNQKYAFIQVKDTGVGIPKAEQARIFDRFYRVNSDRSRHTGGAGLGLAIAQTIAEAHNGSIQVQSIFGKGSTFTVILPTVILPGQGS